MIKTAKNVSPLLPNDKETKYHFTGNHFTIFDYSYMDSKSPKQCSNKKKIHENANDYCRNNDAKFCMRKVKKAKEVSPSVFSDWEIRLLNPQVKKPNFTTPVFVPVEFDLCTLRVPGTKISLSNKRKAKKSYGKCCIRNEKNKNRYLDREKRKCKNCPDGSEFVKTGSYCHND